MTVFWHSEPAMETLGQSGTTTDINASEKHLRECRQDEERSWSFYRYPEEMTFSISLRTGTQLAVSSSALWILDIGKVLGMRRDLS